MKIRSIRAAGLRGATPAGGWTTELRPNDVVHTLVAVHTDDGLVGIGSAFTNDSLVRGAIEVLEPHWRGENALEPERVSEKLHQSAFWLGRGGSLTHAISGIDIALWDILGQVTAQPVGRLLGGRYRDRVRPYASLLMDDSSAMKDDITGLYERGFRAFKIGWGAFGRLGDARDESIVSAARDAAGSDALLMVDAGGSDAFWPNGYKWALRTAHMLANYGIAWFEEPLRPDAFDDYRLLRTASPIPISGGEVLTRRQSYDRWIHEHALDIVQPDVTKVGGLSEARRIGWTAYDHGVKLIPHGWNTAVGLAADLQLASALPDTDLVEYMTGSPYIDGITEGGWRLDADGMLPIPDAPAFGLALDRDAVDRFTDDPLFWKS